MSPHNNIFYPRWNPGFDKYLVPFGQRMQVAIDSQLLAPAICLPDGDTVSGTSRYIPVASHSNLQLHLPRRPHTRSASESLAFLFLASQTRHTVTEARRLCNEGWEPIFNDALPVP